MYKFKEPLIEGMILSRPNRFIMMVEVDGKTHEAHSPTTGRIGGLVIKNIPCLLSVADDPKRRTKYTVEAISMDQSRPFGWIGINQGRSNRYLENFLEENLMDKMINVKGKIAREKRLGNSKIDFKVDNCFIEVKTPLMFLDTSGHPNHIDKPLTFSSEDRMVKQFNDMCGALRDGEKAISILFNQYDAPTFDPPKIESPSVERIKSTVRKALKIGMESWQVNAQVTPEGVSLIEYFKLDLDL